MHEARALKEKIGAARQRKKSMAEELNKLINKMEEISKREPFTDSDQEAFDAIKDPIMDLKGKIKAENKKIDHLTDEVLDMGEDANWHTKNLGSGNHPDVETWKNVTEEGPGADIKVLGPRASLKEAKGLQSESSDMAQYLRDRVRGFTNQMSTTTDSALVPEPLSAEIIDKARNKSRVLSAGARTVDMTSKTLTIAKVSEDASAEWKAENASHSSSDVGFEPLTFEAKTLIGSVKSSVELAEDSGNLASLVQDNLAQQIALKLDYAALMGSGTGAEPTGIINTNGVQMVTLGTGDGGPLTDYSEFSKGVEGIMSANGMPTGVIYSPRTWGTLDRLTATDGQPLMAPQSYKDLAKYQTEQIPSDLTLGTSNDASLAIIADWSQCLIGVRTQIRLEVSRAASDGTNSAWEDLQIWWRAYARYDVQFAHPEHFYAINGIVPA